ncbi:MAG: hypothetical protein CL927_04750 [Deltaproteobacteria bacterium]|nr:hypothetical protein [Deltaproteobacteria bacterium]HCH61940.1 hypothetical protein [Deltaproteobacteria bacterium]
MSSFSERVRALPHLGLGVSTEYGATDREHALDPVALREENPSWAAFLEVGVEVSVGLDVHAVRWAERGWPTTYHFLDVNLDDPEDLDETWLEAVRQTIAVLKPAWLCGDAGLWHLGRRDRGHMLLLPPVLLPEAVTPMADGLRALRAATGLEVLPENPPGAAFLGDLHLLDFFARVAEEADTGLLVDCAHLAMFQRARGLDPLTALDGFPCDRVVELHVAGGTVRDHQGLPWVDDDHGRDVLPDTWQIAEYITARATNLKAVVIECERNPIDVVRPLFGETAARWSAAAGATP